jgi:oligopeptide transport system substrate-binding protein
MMAAPLDDVKVRQALCCAVDKARLASLTLLNTLPVANGILPPGMPGYNAGLTGFSFDPAKAKQLIAASKYPDVTKWPPLVYTTAGYGNDISGLLGGIIDEWRRNLGVEVTVRQLEPAPFQYALNQEKDSMFDGSWIADYPDPQDFLDVLFRTGEQNNSGGYSNPQLDVLLNKAAVEPDPAQRLADYQQAEQIVVQDAAVLPLLNGRAYMLVKPYVKNYVLSPLGYPLLNLVSVQR